MKITAHHNKLLVLSLLFALLCCFPVYAQANFQKTKIAVLDFEPKGDDFKTTDIGKIVAEWFTTTLVKDGRFDVIERSLLQKVIEEQQLAMTGLISEQSSSELGQILGAKIIITGSILQIDKKIDVNARIINVETGSIIAAENVQGSKRSGLQDAIKELTSRIVRNFPLTGYIVKTYQNSAVIDLGRASGLQIGMEFLVFKEGEAIKHPKTGEVLDIEQIPTGTLKITEIGFKVAHGEIIKVEKGEQVLYGQQVQSIRKRKVAAAPRPKPEARPKKTVKSEEKSVPKPKPEEKSQGYVRAEFPEGDRDNLASGGQAPPVLPLTTGSYMMGGNRFSEKPKHYVNIDRQVFLMTREVTFADYKKFCVDSGRPVPDDFFWGRDDRPVINVSWGDAQAYAAWLTLQTGVVYRLPFETEWEFAAKDGGFDIQYSWGATFEKNRANCKQCGSEWDNRQTAPVRSFPPNKSGFHDMVGNVWEWVQDCWVDNYINAPGGQSIRTYTGKCGNYTIRGGAWNSPARQATTTSRLGVWADTKSNYIGFRLVRDPNAEVPKAPEKNILQPTLTDQAKDEEDWNEAPATDAPQEKYWWVEEDNVDNR